MADNVAITAGSGTTIATDDISSAHYQKIKVYDGTADSTNARVVSAEGSGYVSGEIAHDGADGTTRPIKVGNKAVAGVSGVTLVAANDRSDAYAGLDGVPYTRPYCGLEDIVSARISDTTGNQVTIIAAAGAGVKYYLTSIALHNASATNVYADIVDGSG